MFEKIKDFFRKIYYRFHKNEINNILDKLENKNKDELARINTPTFSLNMFPSIRLSYISKDDLDTLNFKKEEGIIYVCDKILYIWHDCQLTQLN